MIWKFEKSGFEGNCELFGVNIFHYPWHNQNKKVEVIDPLYHKKHWFDTYTVHIEGKTALFAAGEFSNGVYGFYLQDFSSKR